MSEILTLFLICEKKIMKEEVFDLEIRKISLRFNVS